MRNRPARAIYPLPHDVNVVLAQLEEHEQRIEREALRAFYAQQAQTRSILDCKRPRLAVVLSVILAAVVGAWGLSKLLFPHMW